ncbi:MAG: Gfo/Idh/MocA family oxidoreductase, partial [Phycisphaerae bacterium]
MIDLGLIGCGTWGRNLLRNAVAHENIRVRAVADLDEEARRSAAASTSAKAYTDLAQMLQRAELDALLIATPSHFHFEHARQALHAGIHVLVEKPMCMTSAEAQALVSLADARGLVLGGCHAHRFLDEKPMCMTS